MASITLEIRYVGRAPEVRQFTQSKITIGREAGHVVLGDPQASSQHAEINVTPTHVTYVDLRSTNGSYLGDGQRITQPIALHPGTVVRIGSSSISLVSVEAGPRMGPRGTVVMSEFGAGADDPLAATALAGSPGVAPSGGSVEIPPPQGTAMAALQQHESRPPPPFAAPVGVAPPQGVGGAAPYGQPQGYPPPGYGVAPGGQAAPGGFGAPGNYGSPPGAPGHGTPNYGAPPQQPGYGAPPQQPGYGGPPQQPGYGAPAPGYGAPPQQPGYGVPAGYPPHGQGGPPHQGGALPPGQPPTTPGGYPPGPGPSSPGAGGPLAAPSGSTDPIGFLKSCLDAYLPHLAEGTKVLGIIALPLGLLNAVSAYVPFVGWLLALLGGLGYWVIYMVFGLGAQAEYAMRLAAGMSVDAPTVWKLQLGRMFPWLLGLLLPLFISGVGCLITAILFGLFLFPVYMIEDGRGFDANKRSYDLASKDWAFAIVPGLIAGIALSVINVVVTLVLGVVPYVGAALAAVWSPMFSAAVTPLLTFILFRVYFQMRQRHEGVDAAALVRQRANAAR